MFSVLHFGSHPSLQNDDCWTGYDFETEQEAIAFFNQPCADHPYVKARDVAYITLVNAEGFEVRLRKNPDFKPSKPARDDEWRRERAMEAGMLHGCDGYNEVMGY